MTVPHEFQAGEIAASSEVNQNFSYLSDRLDVLMNGEPTLIGYNVKLNESGLYERTRTDKAATAVRVSSDGLDVLTTSATSGDLNTQLKAVFGVHATTEDDWVFLDPTWHIQRVNAKPTSIEDYRLTYVHFKNPQTLFEEKPFPSAGSETFDATKYWVPKQAKMVRLMAHVTAFDWSGSALYLMEARKVPHKKYGFVVHDQSDGGGSKGRAGGQGDVPLGTGAYAGKFILQRTAGFYTASCYLQGYWI